MEMEIESDPPKCGCQNAFATTGAQWEVFPKNVQGQYIRHKVKIKNLS